MSAVSTMHLVVWKGPWRGCLRTLVRRPEMILAWPIDIGASYLSDPSASWNDDTVIYRRLFEFVYLHAMRHESRMPASERRSVESGWYDLEAVLTRLGHIQDEFCIQMHDAN